MDTAAFGGFAVDPGRSAASRVPSSLGQNSTQLRHSRLKQIKHGIHIGITGSEETCEPISTALHNFFSIGAYFKLTNLPATDSHFDTETFLNEGREPHGLGLIALSRRAGHYFDVHCALQFVRV